MTNADNNTYSEGLAHYTQLYYDTKALTTRDEKFQFKRAASRRTIPKYTGRIAKLYRPGNYPVSTTKAKEGVPGGSGVKFRTRTVELKLSQWTNHTSFSDLFMLTTPDPTVESAVNRLSYFLGQLLNRVCRGVLDDEAANMPFTIISNGDGILRLADTRALYHLLKGDDVPSPAGGSMWLFVHPYVSFDYLNDPDNNGIAELTKYAAINQAGSVYKYSDDDTIANIGGTRVVHTTAVKVASTDYSCYYCGEEMFAYLELDGMPVGDVVDPKQGRFRIKVRKNLEDNSFDPSGKIKGYASFNVLTGFGLLEGPTSIGGAHRGRVFTAKSSLV